VKAARPLLGDVLEDRELVRKLLAQDDKAYRIFYETYQEKIYKACVYLLGYQDPDAEDVTQEVFLAAFKQLPQFEFRSSLYHWLYRIAMYLCYERIRKRRRQIASLNEELDEMAGPHSVHHSIHQENENEKSKLLSLLEEKKKLLGAPCQELLDLREAQEKSYAQMADILKVPIGTVMSRLARCKESLKLLMTKSMGEASYAG